MSLWVLNLARYLFNNRVKFRYRLLLSPIIRGRAWWLLSYICLWCARWLSYGTYSLTSIPNDEILLDKCSWQRYFRWVAAVSFREIGYLHIFYIKIILNLNNISEREREIFSLVYLHTRTHAHTYVHMFTRIVRGV